MEYNRIVAISGIPGLFELISTKTDGAVVRSLADKTTRFVSGRIHRLTQMESIEVYTKKENVNLVDIFFAMEKASDPLPDEKDEAAIKKYFQKVFPDLDFERVYSSDQKKMIRWFDELKKNNIEIKLSELPEEPVIEEPQEEEEKTQMLPEFVQGETGVHEAFLSEGKHLRQKHLLKLHYYVRWKLRENKWMILN